MTVPMPDPADESIDPSLLMRAAARNVGILRQIVRRFIIVFAVVVVLLVAGGVTIGIVVDNIHTSAVQSCEQGNTFRTNDKTRWDDFIELLIAGAGAHPNPTSLKEAKAYLALVAKTDALRRC
jgi:hypothetical protein